MFGSLCRLHTQFLTFYYNVYLTSFIKLNLTSLVIFTHCKWRQIKYSITVKCRCYVKSAKNPDWVGGANIVHHDAVLPNNTTSDRWVVSCHTYGHLQVWITYLYNWNCIKTTYLLTILWCHILPQPAGHRYLTWHNWVTICDIFYNACHILPAQWVTG